MTDVPDYQYLELTRFPSEPDLFAAAVAHLQVNFPEWTPRTGNTELVLLEAMALMLGPDIVAARMVEYVMTERLMGLFGVTRQPGKFATGRARFTVTGGRPTQIIPAGTILRYQISDTAETVDVETVADLTIITSDTRTGEVNVVATDAGTTGNGIPAGTKLDVVGNLIAVESVELTLTLTGGALPEDDASFMTRASAVLARQTSTVVLPEHYQYAAMSREEVGRARVLNNYNPAAAPPTDRPGHVSVAVAAEDGTALTLEQRAEIEGDLESRALASIAVHAIDPTYTVTNWTIMVRGSYGVDKETVRASVEAEMRAWINPASWDWEPTITQYAVIARVGAVSGVAEVQTVPATKTLAGAAPLPTIGTLTITVN